MKITWFTTPEISEMLDVSGTYLRRISPELKRNQPDAVRKVASKRGKPVWEWSSELVKAQQAKRNKQPKETLSVATKETEIVQLADDAIQPISPQPTSATFQDINIESGLVATDNATDEEVIFELGLHSQSDGNLMQVFTPDEYDRFKSMLIKLPLIEQSHNDLKESYEAHVQTYRNENEYLRRSLEAQQEITQKLLLNQSQRNFIEARELEEAKNPTIVLPKE